MWIAEVIGPDGAVEHRTFLKGPICKVGRREENCISFPADQSISRTHAEIHIDGQKAFLKDLGSKYGTTFVQTDSTELSIVSGSLSGLVSGQVVNFGRMASSVRFSFECITLCTTRLDKKEKDYVKTASQLLHSKILQSPSNASHIITNSISGATAKILTAIVFRKTIVTTEWLSFVYTTKPSSRIPPPDRFFPPLDATSVRLLDYTASRSNLLKGYLILSLNSIDEQYANLFTGCGAIFIAAYDVSQDEVWATIKMVPQIDKQHFCIFSDEFCKQNTGAIAAEYSSLGARYLSATQLATAIFSNAKPVLTGDPPSYKMASSQRFNTQSSQSQAADGRGKSTQKSIFPSVSLKISGPLHSALRTVKEEIADGATAKSSSKDLFTLSFSSLTSPLPAKEAEVDAVTVDLPLEPAYVNATALAPHLEEEEVDLGSELSPPLKDDLSTVKIQIDSRPTVAESKVADVSVKPINIAASSSSSSKGANVTKEINSCGDDSSLIDASNVIPSHKRRRAESPSEDDGNRQRRRVSGLEDGALKTENQEPNIMEYSVTEGMHNIDDTEIVEEESSVDADWMTAVQGKDRIELLKFKNKSFKSEFDISIEGDGDPGSSVPRTEADSLIRILISKSIGSLDGVPRQNHNDSRKNPRDVRRFRKNCVRVADSDIIMSARFMEAVLPKESEREIQLRLNADADESREEFAEQMFSDRFQIVKAAPKRRKINVY